jgi:hypothetical protein
VDTSNPLIPDAKAREECGGVSAMTFWRWERNPSLNFPPAVIINGRKYRLKSQLAAWKATRPLKKVA